MRGHTKYTLFFVLTLAIILSGCGSGRKVSDSNSVTGDKYIIIKEDSRRENFTNEQLRNFIKKTPGKPAIVVRSSGSVGSVSSSSGSDRMCSLLEMALAKQDFDVRDRSLFESAVLSHERTATSNESGIYYNMYKATGVDLLMEVSSYSLNDYYYVTGYYDQKGKYHEFDSINEGSEKDPHWVHPRYVFRGMSLTVKVIVLKDNLVGGSYSYAYVPCSDESGGAIITKMYPLRYRVRSEARDLDAILDDDRNSHLLETRGQRLDGAMEDFLYKVVGWISDDMKGINSDNYSTYGVYTCASLQDAYNTRELFRRYKEAVYDDDMRRAERIESDLWDIEKDVIGNPIIPTTVRQEFSQYIELEVSEIQRGAPVPETTKKNKGFVSKIKNQITSAKDNNEEERYSLNYLLAAYEIQPRLDDYKEAISTGNITAIFDIEEGLMEIAEKVDDNGRISKPVRKEFVHYIESEIKIIKHEEINDLASSKKFTLESLLNAFKIQTKLDQYREAINNKDKKKASAIEDDLQEIAEKVEDNILFPESVRDEFCEYIESAEEEIEQDRKKSSKRKQEAEMTINTSVRPVNSYGKISSAIGEMIELKTDEKITDQKARVMSKNIDAKKQLSSDLSKLKNEYDKWNYLDDEALIGINKLVSTSTFAAGLECPPTESEHISFYLPMLKIITDVEDVIYLFLDGKCIGAGTSRKGFYVDLENMDNSPTFHNLIICAVNNVKKDKVVKKTLYESPIRLDLRNVYFFERDISRDQLKKLNLQ